MPVALRPFQVKAVDQVYSAWGEGKQNVMLVAPTGSGKTVKLSKILYDEPGSSVAVAHRQELVSQISVALARNGVRHRIAGAKKNSALVRVISSLQIFELGHSYFDPNAKTGVGGVDTIVRMDANDSWFKQVRLIVQDEAHHVLKENKWGTVAGMFPNARGLYPTATPARADGKGLGRHADGLMDCLVLAPSMREIINMGYLTDYRYVGAQTKDLSLQDVEVSQTTGDLNYVQLCKAVHKSKTLIGDVVGEYCRWTHGKLGITFAVDVESATDIASAFRNKGVSAEVVSAKTPDVLRAQIIRKFKNREILQLVNVDLFGEGFDLPAIEVVSMARPTDSFPLYAQQWGRDLRLMLTPEELRDYDNLSDAGRRARIAASGKPYGTIIDHVGNLLRHGGPPDKERVWTLDRREKRSSSKSDAIPLRICVNEDCYQPYERVFRCCPYCGAYPPPPVRNDIPLVDGDLHELDAETLAALRGQIAKVDGEPAIPYGAGPEVVGAIKRRHWDRKQAQYNLRNMIAWWAGLEHSQGRGESESYRRFYFKFGVDVGNAQALGTKDAEDLTGRIAAELSKYGIDGTIDATLYFTGK